MLFYSKLIVSVTIILNQRFDTVQKGLEMLHPRCAMEGIDGQGSGVCELLPSLGLEDLQKTHIKTATSTELAFTGSYELVYRYFGQVQHFEITCQTIGIGF